MEVRDFSGKTVEEALTTASMELGLPSNQLNYEVIEEGSNGFLGMFKKPALIRVSWEVKSKAEPVIKKEFKKEAEKKVERKAERSSDRKTEKVVSADTKSQVLTESGQSLTAKAQTFCDDLFKAMKVETRTSIDFQEEERVMNIDLSGPNMGILIGKRGQTLDALQYLISLFVNKESEEYIRIKLDTENYRERRKATLEKLARKIAYSVKRNRKSIALEPMNPYERRVIHSALQNDRYVCTKSEGEEPYRKVVVMLKKDNYNR